MSEEPFYRELAKLDKVIMQPYRLALLEMLDSNGGTADFQHLRNYIGLTSGNLTNHLAKLEEVGLLEGRLLVYQDWSPIRYDSLCGALERLESVAPVYRLAEVERLHLVVRLLGVRLIAEEGASAR